MTPNFQRWMNKTNFIVLTTKRRKTISEKWEKVFQLVLNLYELENFIELNSFKAFLLK